MKKKIEIEVKISIEVENSDLYSLTKCFMGALGEVFAHFINEALLHYAEKYKTDGTLHKLLNLPPEAKLSWKSRQGTRAAVFYTIFGRIEVYNPILLIRYGGQERRCYIVRPLLGVESRLLIPFFMKQLLGLLSGLTTFRVVQTCMGWLGWCKHSLSTIRSSVKEVSSRLRMDLGGLTEVESDGTGIKTKGSGKRGSEIKVVTARKAGGGLRLLGVKVGPYKDKSQWQALYEEVAAQMDKAKAYLLFGDGDDSMLDSWLKATQGFSCSIQRCLWHIPRQLKYVLWKDGVPLAARKIFLSKAYSVVLLNSAIKPEEVAAYIEKKDKRLDDLITYCEEQQEYKLDSTISFLRNAKADLFTGLEQSKSTTGNYNTSLSERLMRTIKQRTKVGRWVCEGAEHVIKVRLAYYYGDLKNHTGLLGSVE